MSPEAAKVIPIFNSSDSAIQKAIVLSVLADSIEILLSGQTLQAVKAFSCLIDPEPEDKVICCRDNEQTVYILGILERNKGRSLQMSFPADASLVSGKGNLNILAEESVTLGAENINSFSRKAVYKSKQAYFSSDQVAAQGRELQASFKTVRVICNLMNTMARQVIDKFKGYIRHTEDNDQVQAGQLTRRTEGLFSMDSRHTVMVSKRETKIDGEKIYMA
ncbi:MAG: DUF3540 domain-containing protein [Desulfohalobiaceae bacterium]|nr:DUF3540 domain-containing protein [Desulfohalobiaceae bacterium]